MAHRLRGNIMGGGSRLNPSNWEAQAVSKVKLSVKCWVKQANVYELSDILVTEIPGFSNFSRKA